MSVICQIYRHSKTVAKHLQKCFAKLPKFAMCYVCYVCDVSLRARVCQRRIPLIHFITHTLLLIFVSFWLSFRCHFRPFAKHFTHTYQCTHTHTQKRSLCLLFPFHPSSSSPPTLPYRHRHSLCCVQLTGTNSQFIHFMEFLVSLQQRWHCQRFQPLFRDSCPKIPKVSNNDNSNSNSNHNNNANDMYQQPFFLQSLPTPSPSLENNGNNIDKQIKFGDEFDFFRQTKLMDDCSTQTERNVFIERRQTVKTGTRTHTHTQTQNRPTNHPSNLPFACSCRTYT